MWLRNQRSRRDDLQKRRIAAKLEQAKEATRDGASFVVGAGRGFNMDPTLRNVRDRQTP